MSRGARYWVVSMPESDLIAVDFSSVPDSDFDEALQKATEEWKGCEDVKVSEADDVKDLVSPDRVYRWKFWKKSW